MALAKRLLVHRDVGERPGLAALQAAPHGPIMMARTSSQERPSSSATSCRELARGQSMASRSNSAVKRLDGPAQGSFTVSAPCSGQSPRGAAACRIVWYWQVSR